MGPVSMAEMLADVAKLRTKSMINTPLVQGDQIFDSEFESTYAYLIGFVDVEFEDLLGEWQERNLK